MDREELGLHMSSYMAFHFAVLGALSWYTGLGFLLPSLGPSIFLLSNYPDHEMNYPQRVVGGQLVGGLAGFVAFELLVGQPVTGNPIPPRSFLGLKIVLATFVAAMLTTGGMFVLDVEHPPAYATALIVSLGFVESFRGLVVFLVAVGLVVGIHEVVGKRLPIWDLPFQRQF